MLAVEAIMHENYVRYMTTLTIVNAIIMASSTIQASLTQGSSGDSGKAFKKSLDQLREALIPGEKGRTKKRVGEIKKILEREAAGGAIKVKPMATDKKVKMKRR